MLALAGDKHDDVPAYVKSGGREVGTVARTCHVTDAGAARLHTTHGRQDVMIGRSWGRPLETQPIPTFDGHALLQTCCTFAVACLVLSAPAAGLCISLRQPASPPSQYNSTRK